jgi:hypothetical protein
VDGRDHINSTQQQFQKMKKTLTVSLAMLVACAAMAYLKNIFSSYDWLNEHSPDIIVVRCTANPPPPDPRIHTITSDINTYSTEVFAPLKGTNVSGSFRLESEQWLNQQEDYLVFGKCENGTCRAIEDFRVVPLGRELYVGQLTNAIAGKSPDEQLQILFKRAIDHLGRQIKKEQEEKQRLETAIRK